jgi:hypothetical protein
LQVSAVNTILLERTLYSFEPSRYVSGSQYYQSDPILLEWFAAPEPAIHLTSTKVEKYEFRS